MLNRPASRAAVFLIAAAALCPTAPAAGPAYNFVKIADDAGPVRPSGVGAINSSGLVAFHGDYAAGGVGIFTGNGGPLTTIADDSGPFEFLSEPSVNDAGTVAFAGGFPDSSIGLYTSSGGSLTTVVAPGGSHLPGLPSINNSGAIAYVASIGPFAQAVYRVTGGTTTVVANTSGAIRYFSSPRINDTGGVAVFADHDAINQVGYYYRPGGGPLQTVVSGFGVFSAGVSPSVNDSGTVAFVHASQATGYGIFTWTAGSLAKALDVDGPYASFEQNVDINNSGTILFRARLDSGKSGIYAGPDPALDKVIELGDPLFGSTLSDLYGIPRMNDRGDVAFSYRLENGTIGLATALAVPEPGAGCPAAIGAACMLSRRRRGPTTATVALMP